MIVFYEDLMRHTRAEYQRVTDFLGLPRSTEGEAAHVPVSQQMRPLRIENVEEVKAEFSKSFPAAQAARYIAMLNSNYNQLLDTSKQLARLRSTISSNESVTYGHWR